MHYSVVTLLLSSLICVFSSAEQKAVQLEARNPEDLKELLDIVNTLGYDIWTIQLKTARVTLRTRSISELDTLRGRLSEQKLNVSTKVIVDDLDALVRAGPVRQRTRRDLSMQNIESFVGDDYLSYDDYILWLRHLKRQYPSYVRLLKIGQTWQGRNLIVIRLQVPGGHNRTLPRVWIDAGIHGREWISPASILYFTWMMLDRAYHNDEQARRLLENFSFFIMPFVNPDGYQLSFTGRHSILRFWRKNLRQNNAGSMCAGVDLNRNFPFAWNLTRGGASSNPCSEIYNGPGAASEPEIRALTLFIKSQAARRKFIAFFTFHSFGQYWFYPWGYTRHLSLQDEKELNRIAWLGATAMTTEQFDQWNVGQSSRLMYLSSGTSEDWARGVAGIKYTYCIELPPGDDAVNGFVLPPSSIRPVGIIVYRGLLTLLEGLINERKS